MKRRGATPVTDPSRAPPVLADTRFVVEAADDGACLDRVLRAKLEGAPWTRVRRAIETGKVSVDGVRVTEATHKLRTGEAVELATRARSASRNDETRVRLVHVDTQVVVVEKPALVSSVPFEPGERDTLIDRTRIELQHREHRSVPPLGIVHRLDKETSGLLVFARTLAAKRHLKQQFRFHSVERLYEAVVHGSVADARFESRLVEDRGDGLRGSTDHRNLGQPAVTHVHRIEALSGATRIECRLETGRTHQIRIHLSEAGHPLLGERVYIKGYAGPLLPAPRLMLHARTLGFVHPSRGERLAFESALPEDFLAELSVLRR